MICVEVVYATPQKQVILKVDAQPDTSMLDIARASGIDEAFPEIDWDAAKMGVWGKAEKSPATRLMQDGERIEIYRPLLIDPKEARRNRAKKD